MGSSASRPEDTPDPAPAGGQQVLTPAERDQVLTALTVYGRARERFKTRTARAVGKGALTVVNAATGVAVSVIAGPIAISARLAAGPVAVAACRSVLGFVLGTIGAAIGLVGATHIYSFKGLELTRLDSPGEGAKKVNHVIVCIMGFLCADQSPSKMFEAVINAHSNTEVWAVKWDGSTTVRALTSALYPLFNEWGRAKNAAEACGVTLAEVISNPLFGSLPITLVGHSLGGRMIMYALKHLQQAELRHPPLKDVVLLGGACPGDVEEWSVLLGSYRGGLINCYNREDSVLRYDLAKPVITE